MTRLLGASLTGVIAAIAMAAAITVAAIVAIGPADAAPATSTTGNWLGHGHSLQAGQSLQSVNGRYRMTLRTYGRLVVSDRSGHWLWASPRRYGAGATLAVRPGGNVVVSAAHRVLWSSHTAGASGYARVVMGEHGALSVQTPVGVAWSSRTGNRCGSYGYGKRIEVDLSEQYAWMCSHNQQVMTTPITSGAVDLGDATPTGTWRLQSKQHDRYLYPAGGGSYYVHYWMPYDGAYGLHDSPWQKFPYGSSRYRTQGSHGCVHVPRAVIAWLDGWAPLGTVVQIRS